jgi:hypothetical protein
MRTHLKILLLFLLSGCLVKGQAPAPSGFASPYSTGYYRIGWIQDDSGHIFANRVPNFTPKYPFTTIGYQHAGVDTALWLWTGQTWEEIGKGGGILSLTGVSPIVFRNDSILCPTCAVGGGITQLNGDGSAGPGSGLQTFTLNTVNTNVGSFGDASHVSEFTANGKGQITVAGQVPIQIPESQVTNLVSDLAGKQATITLGSTSQYFRGDLSLATFPTNLSSFTNGPGYITGITGIAAGGALAGNYPNPTLAAVVAGGTCTNCALTYNNAGQITVASSGSGGGSLTGGGGLSPLFTNGVSGSTLTFTLSTSAANSIFGNNTGSTAAPAYFVPNATTLNGWFGGTIQPAISLTTSGSGAATFISNVLNIPTPSAQTLTYTQLALNNTLSISGGNTVTFLVANATHAGLIDSAHYHFLDSLYLGLKVSVIYPVNGLQPLGVNNPMDSIGIGGNLFQNTTIGTAGFTFSITGLPSKSTALSTDSVLIENAAGQLFKLPVPSGGGGGGLTSFTSPNNSINIGGTLTSPTVDINLANSNTFTAAQNFANINFSGTFLPTVNATQALGSGTLRFTSVFASNFLSAGDAVLGAGSGARARLEINGVDGFDILATRQAQLPAYTTATSFTGTALAGLANDASGNIIQVPLGITSALPAGQIIVGNASGVAADTVFINDLTQMPQLKVWVPSKAIAASSNVTNYNFASVDSVPYYFTTAGVGTEFGGWLANSTSGDSIKAYIPSIVFIGHSIIAGHPWRNSGLESPENLLFQDSSGQISWQVTQLTGLVGENCGIGGQTSAQVRARFLRDAMAIASDPNDGRGSVSITHKPTAVVIDAWINSIAANVKIDSIKADAIWMAQTCFQYNIPCIMLNSVGDVTLTQPELLELATFNKWMMSGALKAYGVTVIDVNSFWNSGTYGGVSTFGNDNIHFSSFVNSGDGIHFTQAGYDSVGVFIVRYGHLPSLTKMAFSMAIAPTSGITNYNRPTNITMNGQAYTLPNTAHDTITITSPLVPRVAIDSDFVWIKTVSSTNVAGTSTVSGYNGISCFVDNNPTNQIWYTQSNPILGATFSDQIANSIKLTAPNNGNGIFPLQVYNYDGSLALQVISNSGTANATMILNGGFLSNARLNNAVFSIYGSTTVNAISSQGPIQVGANSQIGTMQFTSTGATATGIGISDISTTTGLTFQSTRGYGFNQSVFTFNNPFGSTILNATPNSFNTGLAIAIPYTKINGQSDTLVDAYINGILNDTVSSVTSKVFGELFLRASVVNSVNQKLFAIANDKLDNWFNYVSGSTNIGTTNTVASSIFTVSSTTKGMLPPVMTTTQQNAISSPAEGLLVYDNVLHTPAYYNGSAWVDLGSSGGVTSVGTFSGSSIAKGASISGSTITFGPADGTNPGMIIASGSQTLGATLTLSNALTVNSSVTASSGVNIAAKADIGSVSGAGTIVSYAVPGSGSNNNFEIAAYINIVAIVTDIIQVQVTFTGEDNASHTLTFFPQGLTSASISTTGYVPFPPMFISVKQGTTITVSSVFTLGTGSVTFDAGAIITKMY